MQESIYLLALYGTQCAARRAASFVRGDDVLHKDRAGRCTRLLRTRIQVGDAAPMAYMEFIDREMSLGSQSHQLLSHHREQPLIRVLFSAGNLHHLKRKNLVLICDSFECNPLSFLYA
ncbi:hypothetical protein PHAVU_009G111900 [Phaseolus vulgaris]|uniref:Uncharacterized protein n=1 Tax=Phaseolus vulgaris TaxID=3885 RepID=V7AUJ7_PHAVU|nr:hypothetical protein PHAVU_009G111900g [Phaseolus vulgaris]ESW09244.1 hypothetical protein PHAVU_009G111900g [Phaseolus vulgaris]